MEKEKYIKILLYKNDKVPFLVSKSMPVLVFDINSNYKEEDIIKLAKAYFKNDQEILDELLKNNLYKEDYQYYDYTDYNGDLKYKDCLILLKKDGVFVVCGYDQNGKKMEGTNSINEKKENTIIENRSIEISIDNNEELAKLYHSFKPEYTSEKKNLIIGLLLWDIFLTKSYQLEYSYDAYNKTRCIGDDASALYGTYDITTKSANINYQAYINQLLDNEFDYYFINNHPDIAKSCERKSNRNKIKNKIIHSIFKAIQYFFDSSLAYYLFRIYIVIGTIASFLYAFINPYKNIVFLSGDFMGDVFIISGVLRFIYRYFIMIAALAAILGLILLYEKLNEFLAYKNYYNKPPEYYMRKKKIYDHKCVQFIKDVKKITADNHQIFLRYVDELKMVKDKLNEYIPLNAKYQTKKVVESFLSYLIEGRSDNLKESINLFIQEEMQKLIINTIDENKYKSLKEEFKNHLEKNFINKEIMSIEYKFISLNEAYKNI